MAGLPNKSQIEKLIATGKVVEVEDDGMDEGRFFVHLKPPYTWDDGNGVQRTKSFGTYREAMALVKTVKPEAIEQPDNAKLARAMNDSGVFSPFKVVGKS